MGLWWVSWVGMLAVSMGTVTIMVLDTLVTPGTLVTLSIWLVLARLVLSLDSMVSYGLLLLSIT